jgi:hypothetical protein
MYATPEMLPYDEAVRAHEGTSFVPEKRGKQEQEEFARVVNANCDELSQMVRTPEQRAAFDEWVAWYVPAFLTRYRSWLGSRSRCLSTMITGPSGFNVRRAEKANRAEYNRSREFTEWQTAAVERGRKSIVAALPKELADADEVADFVKDIRRSYEIFRDIKQGVERLRGFDPRAFSESAHGKIKRAATNGKIALVRAALAEITALQESSGVVMFTARHGVWKLAETAPTQERPTGCDTDWTGDGYEVVKNWDLDRLQIVFDHKPDTAMIARLKAAGWRWSPREGAWQRKLTQNARYSAREILS